MQFHFGAVRGSAFRLEGAHDVGLMAVRLFGIHSACIHQVPSSTKTISLVGYLSFFYIGLYKRNLQT